MLIAQKLADTELFACQIRRIGAVIGVVVVIHPHIGNRFKRAVIGPMLPIHMRIFQRRRADPAQDTGAVQTVECPVKIADRSML